MSSDSLIAPGVMVCIVLGCIFFTAFLIFCCTLIVRSRRNSNQVKHSAEQNQEQGHGNVCQDLVYNISTSEWTNKTSHLNNNFEDDVGGNSKTWNSVGVGADVRGWDGAREEEAGCGGDGYSDGGSCY